MTDFWKDIEQGARCIRLIEQFLREEQGVLKRLKEHGMATACSEYRIARMRYALGELSIDPNYRDYFPPKEDTFIEI